MTSDDDKPLVIPPPDKPVKANVAKVAAHRCTYFLKGTSFRRDVHAVGTIAQCPLKDCRKWHYKSKSGWRPVSWYHFSMLRKIAEVTRDHQAGS